MDTKAESERLSGLLEQAKVRPNRKDPNSWFIPIYEIRRILDEDALRVLFKTRSVGVSDESRMEAAIQRAQRDFLLAFATLMYCSESAIPKLERACDRLLQGHEPDIPKDDQLPLGEEDAKLCFGRHGLECQNHFCAIILREDEDRDVSDRAVRVPFAKAPEEIPGGGGASGIVHKVVIARGHWMRDEWSPNNKERTLAQKVFHNEGQSNAMKFDRELRNLKELGKAQTVHKNVMFRLGSLKTQDEFSIFYPLAKCDLVRYLYTSEYSHYAPNGDTGKILKLITNATHLVDGLQWLHNPRPGHSIYHFDIKPGNILVVEEDGKQTWKLHDFDLSHPKERSTSIKSEEEFSSEVINQEPRTFRAPEVFEFGRAGHKSDVWSIACILLQVFCFSNGGTQDVNDFDESRARAPNPDESDRIVDYFYDDVEKPGDFKGLYRAVHERIDRLKRDAKHRSDAEFTYISTLLDYFVQYIFVRKEDRHTSKQLLKTMSYALDGFRKTSEQSPGRVDSVGLLPHADTTSAYNDNLHDTDNRSEPEADPQNDSLSPAPDFSPFRTPEDIFSSERSQPSVPGQGTDEISPITNSTIERSGSNPSPCATLCNVIWGRKEWKHAPPNTIYSDLERLLQGPERRELNSNCPNCKIAPLVSATRRRSHPLLEIMLRTPGEPKIDLEVQSTSGSTPLIECYKCNFPSGAISLLKEGARYTEADYKDYLPEMTPDFKRKFKPNNKSWRKKHGLW